MFASQEDSYSHDLISLSAEDVHMTSTSTPSIPATTIKPRKHHQNGAREAPNSPVKKKSRGLPMFKLFGQGPSLSAAATNDLDNKHQPSLFGFSQDSSMSTSQLSQDFADRIGELSILSSQDYAGPMSNYINNTNSTDGFSIPFNPNRQLLHAGSADNSQVDGSQYTQPGHRVDHHHKHTSSDSQRKEIVLPVPFENPFIPTAPKTGIASGSAPRNPHRRISQPRTMWITAFGERPRLLSDFEVFETLGEGSFSEVLKARRRLDGMYYAIKKLKKRITNDKEGSLYVREVCALAILQSCPNIVRYFGSWIDDGYLHIQTEICELGNLELWFVSQTSNKDSSNLNSMSESSAMMISLASKLTEEIPTTRLTRTTSVSSYRTASSTPVQDPISVHSISEDAAWFVLYHIAETLSYLHNNEVVHLDLRPANIFLTHADSMQATHFHSYPELNSLSTDDISDGLLTGSYALRLGDFGHSCRVDEQGFIINEGETRYCARELIATNQTRQVDLKKADIFSLGATIYELCLGRRLGSDGDGAAEWHNIRLVP
jgi:hypothetical protein